MPPKKSDLIRFDPSGRHRELGLELFLACASPSDNAAVSPLGLWLVCAALRAGAGGSTEAAWATRLALPDPTFGELGAELAKLDAVGGLSLAMQVAVAAGYKLEESFLTRVRESLGAGVMPVDFGDPVGTKARIDAWVNDASGGLIEGLGAKIDPLTRLLPVGVVHFNARWEGPFDVATPEPFKNFEGEAVAVPMMRRKGTLRYAWDSSFEIVAVPYRAESSADAEPLVRNADGVIVGTRSPGPNFEAVFLLPREPGIEAFALARTVPCTALLEQLQPHLVELSLPRFTLRARADGLAEVLERGASASLFGADSDYSGICSERGLGPGTLPHEVVVEVDERGTRAAAVTEARILGSIDLRPKPVVQLRFDRPFLFFIHEPQSGTLLFMGQVTDPSEL